MAPWINKWTRSSETLEAVKELVHVSVHARPSDEGKASLGFTSLTPHNHR